MMVVESWLTTQGSNHPLPTMREKSQFLYGTTERNLNSVEIAELENKVENQNKSGPLGRFYSTLSASMGGQIAVFSGLRDVKTVLKNSKILDLESKKM